MVDKVTFSCDYCDLSIEGFTYDVQESPDLICPHCEERMALSVERDYR